MFANGFQVFKFFDAYASARKCNMELFAASTKFLTDSANACQLAILLNTSLASAVSEFIDPVFAKTSPKRSFSMSQIERFGLVFAETGSINSGTEVANFFSLQR
jgi:hypothetical protein